jgi:uridine kinase
METVSWQQAPARILDVARTAALRRAPAAQHLPLVVGINGPMASGKSTLAALLGGLVISTDRYLPDYDGLPEHAWDLPGSSDLERLAQDLGSLRAGAPARIPSWSFLSHSRTGEDLVQPDGLVVVEGLHALHARVRPLLDVCVAVDAPRELRWARCVERERRGERGWTLEQVQRFFTQVAEPTFDAHGRLDGLHAHLRVLHAAG